MLLKRSFSFWLQAAKSDRQSYDDNLIHISKKIVHIISRLQQR